MRKSLITAALAATFISGVALAAASTDTGDIKTLDASKHMLTLADGKAFATPAGWNFADYKVGEKVKVTYELKDGKMTASAIARAS